MRYASREAAQECSPGRKPGVKAGNNPALKARKQPWPHTAILLAILPLLFAISCSRDSAEKDAAVPVQVVTVQKETIQRTVTAEAILFPLQQAAITPKISAPVKAFYIKRGSRVRKGQLLAVLENSDLAAAAQENKGSYDQAQAAYETTTVSDLPQEVKKAQLDAQAARATFRGATENLRQPKGTLSTRRDAAQGTRPGRRGPDQRAQSI